MQCVRAPLLRLTALRFIEVSRISIIIADTGKTERASRWKVVLTHASGAEETFDGHRTGRLIAITCKT